LSTGVAPRAYPARVHPLLQAAARYLTEHPDELVRLLRKALSLKLGLPLPALRWLAKRGDADGERQMLIEAVPPGVRVAATLDLMGAMVRADTLIYIDSIRIVPDEFRVVIRLEQTTMTVLDDEITSPVGALIRSGALDLTKAGSLAAHLPEVGKLLGESRDNRLVLDLMRLPQLRENTQARRILGLVTSFVTIGGIGTSDDDLDVALRPFPKGFGAAFEAARRTAWGSEPAGLLRAMLPSSRR
jgi:hypothetical protein